MLNFKIGDHVHGYFFERNVHDAYDPFSYEGIIIHDFEDGSYIVKNEVGEEFLVEQYFNETIKLIIDSIGEIPSSKLDLSKFKKVDKNRVYSK